MRAEVGVEILFSQVKHRQANILFQSRITVLLPLGVYVTH